MGEREIRAKYGGHLAKAINRAIRAEVAGGNEALERLTQLAGAARQSRWTDARGRGGGGGGGGGSRRGAEGVRGGRRAGRVRPAMRGSAGKAGRGNRRGEER